MSRWRNSQNQRIRGLIVARDSDQVEDLPFPVLERRLWKTSGCPCDGTIDLIVRSSNIFQRRSVERDGNRTVLWSRNSSITINPSTVDQIIGYNGFDEYLYRSLRFYGSTIGLNDSTVTMEAINLTTGSIVWSKTAGELKTELDWPSSYSGLNIQILCERNGGGFYIAYTNPNAGSGEIWTAVVDSGGSTAKWSHIPSLYYSNVKSNPGIAEAYIHPHPRGLIAVTRTNSSSPYRTRFYEERPSDITEKIVVSTIESITPQADEDGYIYLNGQFNNFSAIRKFGEDGVEVLTDKWPLWQPEGCRLHCVMRKDYGEDVEPENSADNGVNRPWLFVKPREQTDNTGSRSDFYSKDGSRLWMNLPYNLIGISGMFHVLGQCYTDGSFVVKSGGLSPGGVYQLWNGRGVIIAQCPSIQPDGYTVVAPIGHRAAVH